MCARAAGGGPWAPYGRFFTIEHTRVPGIRSKGFVAAINVALATAERGSDDLASKNFIVRQIGSALYTRGANYIPGAAPGIHDHMDMDHARLILPPSRTLTRPPPRALRRGLLPAFASKSG